MPMSPSSSGVNFQTPRGPPPPAPHGGSPIAPSRSSTFELTSPSSAPPPVPTHGRSLSRAGSFEPSVLPPKPPAPPAEQRVRAQELDQGHSSEEVTGYEADEDTDMNPGVSVDEDTHPSYSSPVAKSSLARTPSQRAPPPPPPTGAPLLPPAGRHQPERSAPPPTPAAPVPVPHSIPEGSEPVIATSHHRSLSQSHTGGSMTQRYNRSSVDFSASRRSIDRNNTGGSATFGGHNKRISMDMPGGGISNQGDVNQTHAVELDLVPDSQWWLAPNGVPSTISSRKDVLYEVEESEVWKRGGRSYTVRDIYVLFTDYSQTIVTVEFSKANGYVSFQQRVEAPPATLRQDQLESVYGAFGRKVADISQQLAGQAVPLGQFVSKVLGKVPESLPPVGNRSFGALVYHNLANASVRQHDEIRRGDIAVFRGAKFQGHKGNLRSKYNLEVGQLDAVHVGIVYEWDGTKRKIRVYEQPESGSAGGKIKSESYRLNDLKSGEVKVFRVIGKDYVGWD